MAGFQKTGLVCIAACIVSAASAQTVQNSGSGKRVTPEEFAILPWGTTHGEVSTYREIRECGFNLAGFVHPEKLDAVHAAGLKAIVIDDSIHVGDGMAGLTEEEITSRTTALTARTKDHAATYGYYLRDEPKADLYPALGRWAAEIRKAAPKALPYINLFPNYASAGQLGRPTYEEYLESFVSETKPSFLSYDNYSLVDDGSLRPGYFQNLEAVRASAVRHNLPFWNIVLSNAHFNYAEPSPGGLRFQAYTTMAYGARGISYFTYFAPATGNYRLAPIDQFGHRTATWDMLRNVNLQIHQLAPTLVKLKSVNVFHHPKVPEGCNGIATSKYVSDVTGGQFLVGEFEGEGRVYAMVVNCDLHKSTSFGVAFKSPGAVEMVSAYSGAVQPWAGENVWLAAGQGMLLTSVR
ncbi:MAG: hypothetical protein ACR2IE_14025 [Candidatus Sumerlaeaceae bacterium]